MFGTCGSGHFSLFGIRKRGVVLAWKWRLNLELFVLSYAKAEIEEMTSSNYLEHPHEVPPLPDTTAFEQNLQHGIIAVIMLTLYLESCANTVLLSDGEEKYSDGSVAYMSLWNKIEHLLSKSPNQFRRIKSSVEWSDSRRVVRMRNCLVHYKNELGGMHSSYPPLSAWRIGGETVGDFFTKPVLDRCASSVEQLARLMVEANGLSINHNVRIMSSDGSIGGPAYILPVEFCNAVSEEIIRSIDK